MGISDEQETDQKPQYELIDEDRKLVVTTATRVQRELDLSVPIEDLIQSGYSGLLEARRRFKPEKGVLFTTFAYYRIRGAMIDGVRKMAYVPRRAYQRLRALEATDRVAEALGAARAADPPCRTNLSASAHDLDQAISRLTAGYVLAAAGQVDEADGTSSPEACAIEKEACGRVRAAVARLPERERALIEGHYFEERRFDDVAEELGISKSWASRLYNHAIEKLRHELTRH